MASTRDDRGPGPRFRSGGPERGPERTSRGPRGRELEVIGEEKEPLRIRVWKESRSFIFDFIGALIVLLIIIGALYTYTGNWPPLVVVQSGSMQHSDETSSLGVIDTGDLVFVKKLGEDELPVTYVQGVESGYRSYNSYGDVIIFRPNGNDTRTAIIHRAVIWIQFNSSSYNNETGLGGGYDVPSLGLRNVMGKFTIENYEWPRRPGGGDKEVNVATILYKFRVNGLEPHSGFLTKGDDNDDIDQTSSFGGSEPAWIQPVKKEWIIGKSVGELPWFGIIKLKLEGNGDNSIHSNSERNLWIALIVIVASPFVIDFLIHLIARNIKKDDEKEEPEPSKEGKGGGEGTFRRKRDYVDLAEKGKARRGPPPGKGMNMAPGPRNPPMK
ncbi:MAG: S26 family signal peptidase [Thermoplasmatota archaeon]